jgi:hypothetical protein
MNNAEAIDKIRELVVGTHKHLIEILNEAGKRPPTPAEDRESIKSGVLDAGAHSFNDNDTLVARLEEMLDELVASKLRGGEGGFRNTPSPPKG